MARRLINEQGYDPQKLKVLLGGWNTWREMNAKDPKTYPIATGSGTGDTTTPVAIITPQANETAVASPSPQAFILPDNDGTAGIITNINLPGSTHAPAVGTVAPDFEWKDGTSGKTISLSSLRGSLVLVTFWAPTWCGPCNVEAESTVKLRDTYKGELNIISISWDPSETTHAIEDYMFTNHFPWIFLHASDSNLATMYGVQNIPASYFIDKAGVIRAINVGAMNTTTMDAYVKQMR